MESFLRPPCLQRVRLRHCGGRQSLHLRCRTAVAVSHVLSYPSLMPHGSPRRKVCPHKRHTALLGTCALPVKFHTRQAVARAGGWQPEVSSSTHPAAPSTSQPSTPSQPCLSLRVSQRIAAARAAETRRRADDLTTNGAPLFIDPYAQLLADWPIADPAPAATCSGAAADPQQQQQRRADDASTNPTTTPTTALDVVATAHLDRLLLTATAVAAVNRITQGDYRQVVLLGDALDTRSLRLPLPPGTAIYVVAPAEAHAAAEAALGSPAAAAVAERVALEAAPTGAAGMAKSAAGTGAEMGSALGRPLTAVGTAGGGAEAVAAAAVPTEQRSIAGAASTSAPSQADVGMTAPRGARGVRPRGPRPPRGCLLRRVAVDLQSDPSALAPALEAAGFRPDRLSVWVLQGLAGLELSEQLLTSLLAAAAHCAAYHSLLLGELPAMAASQAANALADCGLLGGPVAFGTPDTSYGRWRPEWGPPEDPEAPQRWLFAAQQIRLSGAQMETYAAHSAAAADADEDFFDNFS